MFKGRYSRLEFLINSILWGIPSLSNVMIWSIYTNVNYDQEIHKWMFYALLILFKLLYLNATVQRLHDIDKSGWYGLCNFFPLLNIFLFFYLLFSKGTDGENRYD